MAWTEKQLQEIAQRRQTVVPLWYSAEAGADQPIAEETEATLILLPSPVKQKAAQYIDALVAVNPPGPKADHDVLVDEVAAQWTTNLDAQLADLDPVVKSFEQFKDGMQGGQQADAAYLAGAAPLVQSLAGGFGKIEARMSELRFFKTLATYAADFHRSGTSDQQRREWQSWKRVLLSYR
jgi:hypothetical protein